LPKESSKQDEEIDNYANIYTYETDFLLAFYLLKEGCSAGDLMLF